MMDEQLTRCPHCKTSFLITEADLQRGCGVARCGSCLKIFSATSHLFTLEEIGDNSPASSSATLSIPETGERSSPSKGTTASDRDPAFTPEPFATEQQTSDSVADDFVTDPLHAPDDFASSTTSRTPVMEALDMDMELNELREARNSRPLSERIDAEDPQPKGPAPEGFEQAYYNSHSEEAQDALADFDMTPVAPAEPRKEILKFSTQLSKPIIAIAALASLLILLFLILLNSTRSLSQNPGMSGVVETLCAISSCDHPLIADFQALKTSQSSISQMGDNTQLVDFVLENTSDNTLPFPAIIIELLNEEGTAMDKQVFQPELYLKDMPFADHQLPPELPVAITLTLTDAKPQVEDFRLIFVPALN